MVNPPEISKANKRALARADMRAIAGYRGSFFGNARIRFAATRNTGGKCTVPKRIVACFQRVGGLYVAPNFTIPILISSLAVALVTRSASDLPSRAIL
jgi:hypothetical protein